MKINKKSLAVALVLACTGTALGAATSEEMKQLGTTLTGVGAEKAGNRDGSIPAYTGGLTTPPASYKKGSGVRPDPFEGEKPLYSITAKNMGQYSDKLTEGAKALMKKFSSYRIDVFKTHRTAAFPKFVLENTAKNADKAKTANNGLTMTGAHAGYPFPIPHDGYEAMWNHLVRYNGQAAEVKYNSFTVDSSGHVTLQTEGEVSQDFPYYDMTKPDSKSYYMFKQTNTGPARRAGEGTLFIDPVDFFHNERRAWSYLPGQRRVKLAPDLSFDTPNTTLAGVSTFDEIGLFNGSMARYDFKLIGKKEMLVPYNDYKLVYHSKSGDLLKPNHTNPDLIRWELHRVWVVEATLKPGKRHIYSKRRFYLDEDSWTVLASDSYDARSQLYRTAFAFMTPSYEIPAPYADVVTHYDLNSGQYAINAWPAANGGGFRYTKSLPAKEWTPDALAGSGVR
jgi:hypothetical protein